MILFLMFILTLLFCNIYLLVNLLKHARYFTFLLYNDAQSSDKKVSYAEYCRLMKKK